MKPAPFKSDGLGVYQTFSQGFEAYSEYGRTEFICGDREFILNLGNIVSGDASINPSGPIKDVDVRHQVANPELLEPTFPAPGSTLFSSPNNPQGGDHLLFGK